MRPSRDTIRGSGYTYFVSFQTAERRCFFRHERWAALMVEVLQHYRAASYLLHAYVIMPDHLHILLTPQGSLERSVQNIKGGFSFRAKRAFDWSEDIWQTGFSDHRIRDLDDWAQHIGYIMRNPVKAGLCENSNEYPYLAAALDPIPKRLKPLSDSVIDGGAEAPPLQDPAKEAQVNATQE